MSAASSHRGGGNKWIPCSPGQTDSVFGGPQLEIDRALAMCTFQRLQSLMSALHANEGQSPRWITVVRARNIARSMCRDLGRSGSPLTVKQRDWLKWNVACTKDKAASVVATIEAKAYATYQAKALDKPLRPPTRRSA